MKIYEIKFPFEAKCMLKVTNIFRGKPIISYQYIDMIHVKYTLSPVKEIDRSDFEIEVGYKIDMIWNWIVLRMT